MLTEIPVAKYIFVTWGHSIRVIFKIGLQNMKVGVKANFGWLGAVCLMHADIISLVTIRLHYWFKF